LAIPLQIGLIGGTGAPHFNQKGILDYKETLMQAISLFSQVFRGGAENGQLL
jgi:hypothetical protein